MLVGLVGAPSSGKSTFFKAATLIDVAIASYPFTTIDPNKGTGFVRVECVDKEFNVQCNPRLGYCEKGIRYVPIEILDVAGLVPGAHEGKGLGNKFLNDLNMADVLIHIVDCSGTTNEKGEACYGHNPLKNVEFLEEEIDLWYLQILKKGWNKFARKIQQSDIKIEQALSAQLVSFRVTEDIVREAIFKLSLDPKKPLEWNEEQMKNLAGELRRKTKPIITACNKIDIKGADENYKKIEKARPDYLFIPCSADSELALREANKKEWIEYHPGDKDFKIKGDLEEKYINALNFIKENVLKKHGSTGVQDVLDKAVFEFLKYIAVFPGGVNKLADKDGNVLPDCFLMKGGSTAYDFANKIHGDLAKHMLYAMDVRKKVRIGKEHILKHRDVIEIISAVR